MKDKLKKIEGKLEYYADHLESIKEARNIVRELIEEAPEFENRDRVESEYGVYTYVGKNRHGGHVVEGLPKEYFDFKDGEIHYYNPDSKIDDLKKELMVLKEAYIKDASEYENKISALEIKIQELNN